MFVANVVDRKTFSRYECWDSPLVLYSVVSPSDTPVEELVEVTRREGSVPSNPYLSDGRERDETEIAICMYISILRLRAKAR